MRYHGHDFIEEAASSLNEVKMALYGIFLYLNFNKELMGALVALMVIDTIAGAIKILIINYREFSFKRLILGWVSKIALFFIPFTIAILGKGLGYDLRMLVDISVKILLVSESISIVSNVLAMKTKKEVEDFDLITKFLKVLRAYFIKLGDILLANIKDGKDDKKNSQRNS